MAPITAPNQAACAYDVLAPYYDDFTAGVRVRALAEAIEDRAVALGLSGRRALDLACGTGKSTAQLIARGYSVLACDISPGMIAQAQNRYPQHADRFTVADMRDLPELGEFDLVLCLDDAVNYLLSADDLAAAFSCAARVLAPSGIFAFDVNSLRTYRTTFSLDTVREGDGVRLAWKGESEPTFARGEVGAATVEIFVHRDDGLWERRSMRHVQRHHPPDTIRSALARPDSSAWWPGSTRVHDSRMGSTMSATSSLCTSPGSRQRAAGSRQRAAGSRQRAAGSRQRAAREGGDAHEHGRTLTLD